VRFRILFASAVLLCLISGAAGAQLAGKSVLFVGNSFTYYNNGVHDHLRDLLAAASSDDTPQPYLRIMTISGGTLAEHAGGLRQRLDEQRWNIVVLQGYSNGPITPGKAEPFRESARTYVREIREHGAEPMFFMTWAYTDMPEMTAQLDAAYTGIGAELGAPVIPVGRAFARALAQRPDLTLIIEDKKHPTLAGTYLAACTFYAALQHESPEGLSYTAGLAADDAAFLQRIAWETAGAAQ